MNKHLGSESRDPITADGLDTVPVKGGVYEVVFETEELTAMCPVTGQPDFYHATITYEPAGKSLESKSLKLYLLNFRATGIFAEDLAAQISADLRPVLGVPVSVTVKQQVRGGLSLTVSAEDVAA